ncbi:MAG: hypothetical protein Tsb0015_11430 [Simkaniaceae bacterium]
MLRILPYLFLTAAFAQQENELYIAPVQPTPEPTEVNLRIVFPRNNELFVNQPINAQLKLEGYPIGTMSQFNRAKELYNDPQGQNIHVIIDDRPYNEVTISLEDSFDENRIFNDKIFSFTIPFQNMPNLSRGMHVMRVFPARSFEESLKGPGAFDAVVFYVGQRHPRLNIDLSKPFLTYNQPQGIYSKGDANPILLDFIVKNCRLSADGYKVKLTIDGKEISKLIYPIPYYIYNLSKGKHAIRLDLLDEKNEVVKEVNGLFNSVERLIEIQ